MQISFYKRYKLYKLQQIQSIRFYFRNTATHLRDTSKNAQCECAELKHTHYRPTIDTNSKLEYLWHAEDSQTFYSRFCRYVRIVKFVNAEFYENILEQTILPYKHLIFNRSFLWQQYDIVRVNRIFINTRRLVKFINAYFGHDILTIALKLRDQLVLIKNIYILYEVGKMRTPCTRNI